MLAAALALSLAQSLSAHAFTVSQFHPEGTVRSPRQARVVFSEAMVPFGDPRAAEPFTVDCSSPGKGLWEDSRTWIYEFPKELPAGESCRFRGKKELKSAKGSSWSGKSEFSFDTGGPAVKSSTPYEGAELVQRPAFVLQLDGPVDAASVEKNAYLLVEGMPERIPLRQLAKEIRDELLKETGRYLPQEEREKPYRIALESSRNLPPGKRLQLVWGKGIRSPKGAVNAEDQLLAFSTQRPFRATFGCQRENASAPCLPIGDMDVRFSAAVSAKDLAKAIVRGEGFTRKAELLSKEEHVSYLVFKGPFPPNAKLFVEIPGTIQDENGRVLENAKSFPLETRTGGYPPLAKFAAPFGILESKDAVLPVTVRNVEPDLGGAQLVGARASVGPTDPAALMRWVSRLSTKHDNFFRWDEGSSKDTRGESLLIKQAGVEKFTMPGLSASGAFEVVGIPLQEKGFHVVELESRLLGQSLMGKLAPMYVAAGALVTNLGVHLKWGSEGSLVWVTSLDEGKPVSGARVRAADCEGKVHWEGVTDKSGAALAEGLPRSGSLPSCGTGEEAQSGGLIVLAEKDGDFSFTLSSWDNGIEPWRFQVPVSGEVDETMAHTVLDRALFRAGDTVHMKHFLRERYLRGIRLSRAQPPKSLVLLHSGGRKIVLPLAFSPAGTAESRWQIPKGADLGSYSIYLSARDEKAAAGKSGEEEEFHAWGPGVHHSGSFRVEEFRLPVMAGSLQWPAGTLVKPASVPVDLGVRYLAGGGASGLPVKLRARAEKLGALTFPAFEGYTFAAGNVKAGRVRRGNEGNESGEARDKVFPDQQVTLDSGGGARAVIKDLPGWDQPYRLSVEAEYRDPNGEIQAVSRGSNIYPAAALVGLAPDGWVSAKDKVRFRVAAVSPEGKPLKGRKVSVRWLERKSYSHRKRIVGGFYAYENFEELSEKGAACGGSTDERGLLHCEGAAPGSGNLVLVADLEEGGRHSRSFIDVFVAGGDEWWFDQENDDRIDLLPERKSYEGGETARLQARSPFREATALVTVEREGVIDYYVREVSGKNPVIELPVKDSYAPNVFISAFLVRGRVGEPKATALVDLARPAHKLGLARINVGWKAHSLLVSVSSDKAEYKAREKAKVRVSVTRAIDGKPAAKGEVVLAAVDEALLELLPNGSWDLLPAMMGERSLKVRTSTAQSQVVGRRHYGLKAQPPGGGGGRGSASRELFDTLLFWKGTVPLNSKGEAEAEIPLNDSLTSFRIVAVASEEADRFGTGSRTVRARQDLMLFSGVSPLARHGDKTRPELTVRNSGDKPLKAEVSAKAGDMKLASQILELAPGAAKVVSWAYQIGDRGTELAYEFEAVAGEARDRLKITQRLEPALRESVLQATLERLDGKLSLPVESAKGTVPGTGGVEVQLERSLAANLATVRRYMEEYPYDCLEQRVSKAVALRDPARWKAIAEGLGSYVDASGLLRYFPRGVEGSDVLTTYVLAVAHEAGYALPGDLAVTVVKGLQGFVSGTSYYAGFTYPAADLAIRKLAAMEALSRYQAFDPSMLSLIQLDPTLWPVRALLDWYNLLQREQKIPERAKRLVQARQLLRAKLEWRGSVVGFKSEPSLWWLMSSIDESANRLLLAASGDAQFGEDIGRLARGSVGRLRSGRWDLTTANAWGVLAMERFSQAHEREPVSGKSVAELAGKKQEGTWAEGKRIAPMAFAWPKEKATLALNHAGSGKPWALLTATAAVKLGEPIFKGYRLKRTVVPVEQKTKGKWAGGDVYRVTLEIEAPSDMTWVAVSDPVPAGATVLGSGLGNDSALLVKGEKQRSWGTIEERSFSGFRSFFEFMPKGTHKVEYSVRLNGAGVFQLPNSRVEAMYAPEMYAEAPNDAVEVLP